MLKLIGDVGVHLFEYDYADDNDNKSARAPRVRMVLGFPTTYAISAYHH
jgi:hypothetical protein